jgi:hypothetical protein
VTASVTVWLTACAPAPPLAVTVAMKEFVDGALGALDTLLPPLHPLVTLKNATMINNAPSRHERFFRGHVTSNIQASSVPRKAFESLRAELPRAIRIADDWAAGLLMLSAICTGVSPSRLGCAGRNVHEEPRGSPEQLSDTAPMKPRPGPGVSRRLVVPGPLPEIDTFPGLAEIRKSGLPTTIVAAPEVEPTKFGSPEYTPVILCEPLVSWVVVRVASKLFTWTGFPNAVFPVKNWTVPVGSIVPFGSTMAWSITAVFGRAPAGIKRIVCVGPLATLMLIGPALLAEKLASPE